MPQTKAWAPCTRCDERGAVLDREGRVDACPICAARADVEWRSSAAVKAAPADSKRAA